MADAATETAPNGKTPNEEMRVGDPVKFTNADDSSAKGLDDMKACGNRDSKDEVALVSVPSKSYSGIKTEEVAAEETTGVKKGTEEPMEEDSKACISRGDAHDPVDARSDVQEAKLKDGHKRDEAKGGEAKDSMEIDRDASKNVSSEAPAEEKVAMDIDENKQVKSEDNTLPVEEQKAGVVVNPKKKGRRPKRSSVEPKPVEQAMETDEAPKEEMKEIKKKSRKRREPPVTPLSERDRPARERKSIERFVASVDKGKKELVIKQGTGTPLMDIPNVAYKLAKRAKGDEILNMLHSLLYNKRGKASVLKYNIYRFSGFVWGENEEKEKNKVKEKLERYTKEGLGQLIDVLDLHLPKTGKKEELVVKVLQFLESPYKTTDVSLGEKEQKLKEKKRKSRGPGRGRGGGTPGKKRRKIEDSTSKRGRGRKQKGDSESDGDGRDAEPSSGDEDLEVEEVEERLTFKESEEEDDEDDEDYEAKHKPQKKTAKSSKNDTKEIHGKASHDAEESEGDLGLKKSAVKGESKSSANDFSLGIKTPSPDITRSTSKPPEKVYTKGSRKKNKELKEKEMLEKDKEKEKLKEKEVPERKRRGKEKEKSKEKHPEKSTGRGGRRGKETIKKKKSGDIPTDEVLQNEIRDLLKDLSSADFSKVTFMDIVIQLEKKFNVDLSVKKAHVKLLIRQEVSRLAEEPTDEEAPVETDAHPEGEDEAQAEETTVVSQEGKTPPSGVDGEKDADSDGAEESVDVSGDTAAKDVETGETSETADATKAEQQKDSKKDTEQSQSTSTAEETADGGAEETD